MTEGSIPHVPHPEQRRLSYHLPPGAQVLVQEGQRIAREAKLARVPRTPFIEPYATDLEARLSEANAALSVRDGTRVRGGESVARRRSGFRTHILNAATNGVVTVRASEGVYTLAPVVPAEIVSRFGGTVYQATSGEIIVDSLIARCPVSIASAGATAIGTLLALTDLRSLPSAVTAEVLLIPHLASFAALRGPERSGVSLVIAGTVTDAIAWELLTARNHMGAKRRGPHIATIAGPGDAASGDQFFNVLREWNGRTVWLEDAGGTLTLCVEAQRNSDSTPELAPAASPSAMTLRDPAHWGQRAEIVPPSGNTLYHPALSLTVRVADTGRLVVPVQNGEILVDKSH